MLKVTGQVVFEKAPSKLDALMTVKLELVSLADAPSATVTTFERRIHEEDIIHLPFELDLETEINPQALYTVSAHISLHPEDNPSDIQRGDYITMESYPVLTQGNPHNLEVVVKQIT